MIRKIFVIILLSLTLYGTALAKVNINTADATELDTIPEVGPATAAKIIAYREANGPFAVIEDIMKVSGIKDATFAKMKDYITVNDEVGDGDTPTDPDDDPSDGASSNDDLVSGHADAEELTVMEKKETFKIGAGRRRVAVVGAPVSFEATASGAVERAWFEWSFGDGGRVRGRRATHCYQFPGIYNVVLNGKLGDEEAVARTQVEVLEPELSLALISGAIKIVNPTKREVNLGGWRLSLGNQVFVIPPDTLLDPSGTTIIPAEISHLQPDNSSEVVLQNPSGRVATRYAAPDLARQAQIAVLQNQLAELRAQLASITEAVEVEPLIADSQGSTSVPSSTSGQTVIELPKPTNWLTRIINEVF